MNNLHSKCYELLVCRIVGIVIVLNVWQTRLLTTATDEIVYRMKIGSKKYSVKVLTLSLNEVKLVLN